MGKPSRRRLLIISQVFVPDPASVGQHLADVAREVCRRGFDVRVITSSRGYDDPTARYPRRERMDGVEVIRLPLTSFGKATVLRRILGAISFTVQATLHGLLSRGTTHLLVSTSPPIASAVALFVARFRQLRLLYWVMDLNPDQAIALGVVGPRSPAARLLDRLNRGILGMADAVVVMDRFMAERVLEKKSIPHKIHALPPWAHEMDRPTPDKDANPFRSQYVGPDALAIMYSGNHTYTNPIAPLLEATRAFEGAEDVRFLFVGGGAAKQEVAAFEGPHVVSLPYQPMEALPDSLSAADVHVVTLGDRMVGIVHPCKVYGALAVGRPILFMGPAKSHVGDILDRHEIGWQVEQGDVEGLVQTIQEIIRMDRRELTAMGDRARSAVRRDYDPQALLARFVDILEGPSA